jgi:glycosyltransferase involved in cell wall biosynthesis
MTQSREDFTVAISTFNRSGLVGYAIDSVLQQDTPVSEIIVVDDASTDNTADLIRARYPNVRYLRQAVNSGPCAARNRALREATNERVVMLDDDDTLLPNALSSITQQIKDGSEIEKYPVLMFGHSGGVIPCEFLILKMSDYVSGVVKGDFLPVIRRKLFLSSGFSYPEIRSAGEHLLWWKVAEKFGIPTWAQRVAQAHSDAPIRLTSAQNQVRHACAYAELQELTLAEFGSVLARDFPSYYLTKRLGAATYRLLAGDRSAARGHLREAWHRKASGSVCGLWALSFLPIRVVRGSFAFFRKVSRAQYLRTCREGDDRDSQRLSHMQH